MSYLLVPGRHIITTAFQEHYLASLLNEGFTNRQDVLGSCPDDPIDHVVFVVTSANQDGSRYNPVSYWARVVGLDRFAQPLRERGITVSFVPVPHFHPTDDFASLIFKYAADELHTKLNKENTAILSSTPTMIEYFRALGFGVCTAEYSYEEHVYYAETPTTIVRQLAECDTYVEHPAYNLLSHATKTLWSDFPNVYKTLTRIWREPLLTEAGSLTEYRNYSTYAFGMGHQALLEHKYNDIERAIVPGKIVDEGCADGALLTLLAKAFPDSDLLGIDITGEFIARAKERQRAGEFGESYVNFFQRNIFDDLFEENSIDTTICNSTTHEIYSYGEKEASLRSYLTKKYQQLKPGGRLVIRDVVGPSGKDEEVLLWLKDDDGESYDANRQYSDASDVAGIVSKLSTKARFFQFTKDFLNGREGMQEHVISYTLETHNGHEYVRLSLRDAMEFLSKKDYADNWLSEMNETFCFWDFTEWCDVISSLGFSLVQDHATESKFSRAYSNSWIVENRFEPVAKLYKPQESGILLEMPFPVTNMVLVAEKPIQ